MSELIAELKKEHSLIVETLNKVKELGIVSKEAKDALLSVKSTLISHLKKEDEGFYPPLRKQAQNDKNLKHLLDALAKDMQDIAKEAFGFFDKCCQVENRFDFASDFGRLFARLNLRVRREEDVLFPEYEKLKK